MGRQCEYCGYKSRDEFNLRRHHRRCHIGDSFPRPRGKGDWECEQCNFKTSWKGSLRRHYNLMHKCKPKLHGFEIRNSRIVANSCAICKVPFIHQSNLVRHYTLRHPWEVKATREKSTQTYENCEDKTKHGKLKRTETKNREEHNTTDILQQAIDISELTENLQENEAMETNNLESETTDLYHISSPTTLAPYEIQKTNPIGKNELDWNKECTSNPNLNSTHSSFRATELTFYDDWDLLDLC